MKKTQEGDNIARCPKCANDVSLKGCKVGWVISCEGCGEELSIDGLSPSPQVRRFFDDDGFE